jgi:hypothetical protein
MAINKTAIILMIIGIQISLLPKRAMYKKKIPTIVNMEIKSLSPGVVGIGKNPFLSTGGL